MSWVKRERWANRLAGQATTQRIRGAYHILCRFPQVYVEAACSTRRDTHRSALIAPRSTCDDVSGEWELGPKPSTSLPWRESKLKGDPRTLVKFSPPETNLTVHMLLLNLRCKTGQNHESTTWMMQNTQEFKTRKQHHQGADTMHRYIFSIVSWRYTQAQQA